MDKENLIAAGFHFYEGDRHAVEYSKVIDEPAKRIEGVGELGYVVRFNRMIDKVRPLLKPQESYGRDWHITPEVPLAGVVEGQDFTVYLSIQVQNPGSNDESVAPHIRTDGKRPLGMSGMQTSRSSCERWEESQRRDEPLEELDHVEESVEVYLRALAELTPQQLHELGFPSDYSPEAIQLSLLS